MGLWAGIKYALNSTLGTTRFKPLNTLITEKIDSAKNDIKSHITGQKSLGASDSVYAVISSDGYGADEYGIYTNKFKAKKSGTIRVLVKYRGSSGNTAKLYIYKNGLTLVHTVNAEGTSTISDGIDINVSEGDIISFKRDGYITINYIKIGAVVIDGTLGEVIQ